MDFPSVLEFTSYLFLAFFFRWIKAALCVAAALFIRPWWLSMGAAVLIGLAEVAIDMGLELFIHGFTDFYRFLFFLIPIAAALAWWGIGRGLLLLVRRFMPRFAS